MKNQVFCECEHRSHYPDIQSHGCTNEAKHFHNTDWGTYGLCSECIEAGCMPGKGWKPLRESQPHPEDMEAAGPSYAELERIMGAEYNAHQEDEE